MVAFCKAKITWFAVNTQHSRNCWDNTRLGVPQTCVLHHRRAPCLAFSQNRGMAARHRRYFTQRAFLVSVRSVILGSISSKKEALPSSLVIGEEILGDWSVTGLSLSLLLSAQWKHMGPYSQAGLEHVLI